MDPSKISLILPNVQLVPGSEIKPTDPKTFVVSAIMKVSGIIT